MNFSLPCRVLAIGCLLGCLTACQQTPTVSQLDTDAFSQLVEQNPQVDARYAIETEQQIFGLPEHEIEALRKKLSSFKDYQQRSKALLLFIFKHNEQGLQYVNGQTLTAAQTLQQGQANCLSLTILAYSLAHSVGFPTEFRDVAIPEYWITRNGESFLNGHVNLQIQAVYPMEMMSAVYREGTHYLIDFERGLGVGRLPYNIIQKTDIIALFYNNKAAETLEHGDADRAFAYLRAAARVQPRLPDTWNNMAIWYKRQGDLAKAEMAYRQSLRFDAKNSNTLSNLAILYRDTERAAQAVQLEKRVAKLRETNPYYFLMLGNEASDHGQWDMAKLFYQRSLNLNDRIAETHFAMAKVLLQQGKYQSAAMYLNHARKLTSPGKERDVYQHKLDVLQTVANLGK